MLDSNGQHEPRAHADRHGRHEPPGPEEDLPDQLRIATLIAVEAADLALGYHLRGVETLEKGPRDLVSEADRAVEALIIRRLAQAFPADHVIGEEGSGGDLTVPDGVRCWYVDPIDGTTNFLKGLPAWGVSIGLADTDGTLLLGVIALPRTDEVFTAARGHGARRNGVPIACSAEPRLDRTLITYALVGDPATHWGADARPAIASLMAQSVGTRMQGCSVADLTAVAMGTIDATVAGGMSPWDVAAGLLIASEAGARITTPDGTPSTTADTAFIASGPAVHDQLRGVLVDHQTAPAS